MCIVIGKYFEGTGWVGFKNRDRNYIPEISFKKIDQDGLEIRLFWDDVTQYCEGINSAGVAVLSASLQVQDDEKEISKTSARPSKDGFKIKKALGYKTVREVARSLVEQKLPGSTLIFDEEHMFLLEGNWKPGEYDKKTYLFKIREIPKDEIVVRTNHGIWLPWAGYRDNAEKESESLSRISSESRKLIAEYVTERAKRPIQVLDGLTENFTNNGQLNALRTTLKQKLMRTTSQIMIIPKERTMYVRPVQSNIDFNFWDLNDPKQKTWVEILSNRVLFKNLKNLKNDERTPLNGKLPFKSHLDHDS